MHSKLGLKYAVTTALIITTVMGVTIYTVSERNKRLIFAQIEAQARALFQQIVITRRWVADHGGVFVEKLPWVKPNPYLSQSVITDHAGRRYVKQNPALVTRQLSSYAQKEGLYFFHITSLKLINPDNAPDEFETRALKAFETDPTADASTIEKIGNFTYFRYISPLKVEASCLACHSHQGYKIGDVRGAISISVPMDDILATIKQDQKYLIVGGLLATILLMLSLYFMTRLMVIKPISTMRAYMHKFSRDGNSDIPILETGDEIRDLSISFRDMAKSIDEYHRRLQEKIAAATRELTQKNEELTMKNRSRSDFVARIAHELRTPLTTIKGAMDYLSVKLNTDAACESEHLVFFDIIKRNAERLIRLVNNLLDYERIELGELEMNFREVNIKHTFEDVVASFRPIAEENNVNLRLVAEDAVACVDEDRIRQVLTNLLSNAMNFAPHSSEVVVYLSGTDGVVTAMVEDQGPGIPESDRERIFEQFYTKNVKDGTGLGLAICQSIILAHRGEIGAKNGKNGGSCFWFTIPKEHKDESRSKEKTSRGG